MSIIKKAKWKFFQKRLSRLFLNDVPRYANRRWEQFDAVDDVLHPLGLTTYRPRSIGFGGFGAFLLGAAAGSILGLLLAPKSGVELRGQVKDRTLNYLHKVNPEIAANERTVHA